MYSTDCLFVFGSFHLVLEVNYIWDYQLHVMYMFRLSFITNVDIKLSAHDVFLD